MNVAYTKPQRWVIEGALQDIDERIADLLAARAAFTLVSQLKTSGTGENKPKG